MDSLADAKRAARSAVRTARRALQAPEREAAAVALGRSADQVTALLDKPLLTIAAYLAAPGEPDLSHALRRWHQRGHRVVVPLCAPQHQLTWVLWHPDVEVGVSALAPVPEPVGAAPASAQDADLVLVPALSVGFDGTRLGQGGGYYDRFLADHAGLHVGVVLDSEVVQSVPAQPWDAVLDAVWTPSGVSRLPFALG